MVDPGLAAALTQQPISTPSIHPHQNRIQEEALIARARYSGLRIIRTSTANGLHSLFQISGIPRAWRASKSKRHWYLQFPQLASETGFQIPILIFSKDKDAESNDSAPHSAGEPVTPQAKPPTKNRRSAQPKIEPPTKEFSDGYPGYHHREKYLRFTVEQGLRDNPVIKQYLTAYPDIYKTWERALDRMMYFLTNTDVHPAQEDTITLHDYKLERLIDHERYYGEKSGHPEAIHAMTQEAYFEILRQIGLHLAHQEDTLSTHGANYLADSMELLIQQVGSREPDRLKSCLTSLVPSVTAHLDNVPFSSNRPGRGMVTKPGPFSALSVLLTHWPLSDKAQQAKFIGRFVKAVTDPFWYGYKDPEQRKEILGKLDEALVNSGQSKVLAEGYKQSLPLLYARAVTSDQQTDRFTRSILSYATNRIRALLPASEAQTTLDSVYPTILLSLLTNLKKIRVRHGYLSESLALIHEVIDSFPTAGDALLLRVYSAVAPAIGSVERDARYYAIAILDTIERRQSARLKENPTLFTPALRQAMPDMLYHAMRHEEERSYRDGYLEYDGAQQGMRNLSERWKKFVGPTGTLQWTLELVKALPSVMAKTDPALVQELWYHDFAAGVEAAPTPEALRVVLVKHASPLASFFLSKQTEIQYRFADAITPLLFPEALRNQTPILRHLSSGELLLAMDYLLQIPSNLSSEEAEITAKQLCTLMDKRDIWPLKNSGTSEEFHRVADTFGYQFAYEFTFGDEVRQTMALREVADRIIPKLQANPDYLQDRAILDQLMMLKRMHPNDLYKVMRLIDNFLDAHRGQPREAILESFATINHILSAIRIPQPQATPVDAVDEDDKLAIMRYVMESKFDAKKLRAIFDIYFNSQDKEAHKNIDRFETKFAARNPAAFYDAMPESFRVIHRQQDRKLDYNFLIPFLRNLVDPASTQVVPEAELFFKLFTSKKLHRYRNLKSGFQDKAGLLNHESTPETVDSFRKAIRLVDKKHGLAGLAMKAFDEKDPSDADGKDYRSYPMARELTAYIAAFIDLVTVERAATDPTVQNYALEWKPRILNAMEAVLAATSQKHAELAHALKELKEDLEQFSYFYRNKKMEILLSLFEQKIKLDPQQRLTNLKTLVRYAKNVALNQDKNSVIDLVMEFVQTNAERPEVIRVMYEALMQEARGTFKTWRYQSPDYLAMLATWLDLHGRQSQVDAEKKLERIQTSWEKNQYYSVEMGVGPGVMVGFTDNFSTLLNIGNPSYFNSCQATYKPNYNRGLAGSTANGWNKVIAVYDSKGKFLARRLVRLRMTRDGELVLLREGTYGDPKYNAVMDELLAKVASDMGLRYQNESGEELSILELPLWAGHSEWEYSDMYGKQLPEDVGLIRLLEGQQAKVAVAVPLAEPLPIALENSAFTPLDEASFRLKADHIVEMNERETPLEAFRSSIPREAFIEVGGEWRFRGFPIMSRPWELYSPEGFVPLPSVPESKFGQLFMGRKDHKLYYFLDENGAAKIRAQDIAPEAAEAWKPTTDPSILIHLPTGRVVETQGKLQAANALEALQAAAVVAALMAISLIGFVYVGQHASVGPALLGGSIAGFAGSALLASYLWTALSFVKVLRRHSPAPNRWWRLLIEDVATARRSESGSTSLHPAFKELPSLVAKATLAHEETHEKGSGEIRAWIRHGITLVTLALQQVFVKGMLPKWLQWLKAAPRLVHKVSGSIMAAAVFSRLAAPAQIAHRPRNNWASHVVSAARAQVSEKSPWKIRVDAAHEILKHRLEMAELQGDRVILYEDTIQAYAWLIWIAEGNHVSGNGPAAEARFREIRKQLVEDTLLHESVERELRKSFSQKEALHAEMRRLKLVDSTATGEQAYSSGYHLIAQAIDDLGLPADSFHRDLLEENDHEKARLLFPYLPKNILDLIAYAENRMTGSQTQPHPFGSSQIVHASDPEMLSVLAKEPRSKHIEKRPTIKIRVARAATSTSGYRNEVITAKLRAAVSIQLMHNPVIKNLAGQKALSSEAWNHFSSHAIQELIAPSYFEGDPGYAQGPLWEAAFNQSEALAAEGIGNSEMAKVLLCEFYAETLRQLLTFMMRVDDRSPDRDYSIRFLIAKIIAGKNSEAAGRHYLSQIFDEITLEATSRMGTPDRLPKYSNQELKSHELDGRTSDSTFAVMEAVFKNSPPSDPKLFLSAFTQFLIAAGDKDTNYGSSEADPRSARVRAVEKTVELLKVQRYGPQIAQAYVQAFPTFFAADHGNKHFRRNEMKLRLALRAGRMINALLPAADAPTVLAQCYRSVIPLLVAEFEDPRFRNIGWFLMDSYQVASLQSMALSLKNLEEVDLTLLRRIHRALAPFLGHLNQQVQKEAKNILEFIENRLLSSGNREIVLASYKNAFPDLLTQIYESSSDSRRSSEDLEAPRTALEHIQKGYMVSGKAEKATARQSLLDALPGLLTRLKIAEEGTSWLREFSSALHAATNDIQRRHVFVRFADPLKPFLNWKFVDAKAVGIYANIIVPLLFTPTTQVRSPILSKLTRAEQFRLYPWLIKMPLRPSRKQAEDQFKSILNLLKTNKIWSEGEVKAFQLIAEVIGYENAFELSIHRGQRDHLAIGDLKSRWLPFLKLNPGLLSNPLFLPEIVQFKRVGATNGESLGDGMEELLRFARSRATLPHSELIRSIQTINHILAQARKPQPQATELDIPNQDDKLELMHFLLGSNFQADRLRAIFDIYFNSDDRETNKHIDKYEKKFEKKNPGVFYESMPESFRLIHRQQDRKLDYNLFVTFMKNLVDPATTTLAPEAEIFFKLLTSKKLHRFRSLKAGIRNRSDLLGSKGTAESIERFREALRLIDREYDVRGTALKLLDEKVKLPSGAMDYQSFVIARSLIDLIDLAGDLILAGLVEKDPLAKNFALEWKPRLMQAMQKVFDSDALQLPIAISKLNFAIQNFKMFFKSQKLKILYALFQKHVIESEAQRSDHLRLLVRYSSHLPINQDEKSVIDSVVELLQTNPDRPEVTRVMHEALMNEARGTFKAWRYQSPDYLKMLARWLEMHKSEPAEEVQERLARIRSHWEKNQYFTAQDTSGGSYVVGFTDNFSTLLNLGNPSYFGSCQATYKPAYNRGLPGYVANGWNKAIVIFDQKHNFVERRIVRLRVTSNGELILMREHTYGKQEHDDWLDQVLSKVAHDMGVRYQPDLSETAETVTFPLWKGHSAWEYSDTYGNNFEDEVGLIHLNEDQELNATLALPLRHAPEDPLTPGLKPIDEAFFRETADRMVDASVGTPAVEIQSSAPRKDFVSVGDDLFFRGVKVHFQPAEHFSTEGYSVLDGAPLSRYGKLYLGKQDKRLYYFSSEGDPSSVESATEITYSPPASLAYWLVLAWTGDVDKAIRAGESDWGHFGERILWTGVGLDLALLHPEGWWIPLAFQGIHVVIAALIAVGLTNAPRELGRQALSPRGFTAQFLVLGSYGLPAFVSKFAPLPTEFGLPLLGFAVVSTAFLSFAQEYHRRHDRAAFADAWMLAYFSPRAGRGGNAAAFGTLILVRQLALLGIFTGLYRSMYSFLGAAALIPTMMIGFFAFVLPGWVLAWGAAGAKEEATRALALVGSNDQKRLEAEADAVLNRLREETTNDVLLQKGLARVRGMELATSFEQVNQDGKNRERQTLYFTPDLLSKPERLRWIIVRRAIGMEFDAQMEIEKQNDSLHNRSVADQRGYEGQRKLFWLAYAAFESLKRRRLYPGMLPVLVLTVMANIRTERFIMELPWRQSKAHFMRLMRLFVSKALGVILLSSLLHPFPAPHRSQPMRRAA